MWAAVDAQMQASDAMLLGRETFEGFAAYWPQQSSTENDMADPMNGIRTYVVSTTLESADWQNSTLINGDVAAELARSKREPGKNIGMTGSGVFFRSLPRDGLLDELRLLMHPIVVGTGKRLFPNGVDQQGLKLVESETFDTGVLYLTYRAADR